MNYNKLKKKKELKIVWLCQITNNEMNSYFSTSKDEQAPWINRLIEIFANHTEIELHIISPNIYDNTNKSFIYKGVNYHFFKHEWRNIFRLPKKLYNYLKYISFIHLNISLIHIKRMIREINPDLIHLHGVEMPRFSVGVLPFIGKYPILVSIAGFISRTTTEKCKWILKQIKVEKQILSSCLNFGVKSMDSIEYIKNFNPNAVFFWHNYPYKVPDYSKSIDQLEKSEFDFVFFSRVCKDKGIEDLLLAMKRVVEKYPASKLLVIGKAEPSYLSRLKEECFNLNIQDNVVFTGFLNTQREVHNKAINAKICVHPSYHDNLPGPIIESMYMGLAIITYNVGGIDMMNEERESILLVEKGNVELLGVEMINLLSDHRRRQSYVENARLKVKQFYNDEKLYSDIIDIYHRIIRNSY